MVKYHEDFALKVWPDKRKRRDENYIRWKFRASQKGEVSGLLLALSKNRILGQLGLIPVKLKFNQKIYEAQWACDLMVDPEFRKRNIGRKLLEVAVERKIFTLGNNPSPEAERVMKNFGFQQVESGRTMFFPIKSLNLLKWVIPDKINFIKPMLNLFVQPYFTFKIHKILKEKSNFFNCTWRDIIELIDSEQSEHSYTGILHDEDFLKWRMDGISNFTNKPGVSRTSSGNFVIKMPFPPFLNVYDWSCKKFADIRETCAYLVNAAVINKNEIIQMIANDTFQEKSLRRIGFIGARNIEKIIYFSKAERFGRNVKFNFSLYDSDVNL